MQPKPSEVIQDPACGTAGFLIAADAYIRQHHDLYALTEQETQFYTLDAFVGVELVPNTRRLAQMNCLLHDIGGEQGAIKLGNSLGPVGQALAKADVQLATLNWVDWFNKKRVHSALGYVSPFEFQAMYYDKINPLGQVA